MPRATNQTCRPYLKLGMSVLQTYVLSKYLISTLDIIKPLIVRRPTNASISLLKHSLIVIVLVNYEFLKSYSKAKQRAQVYSRALHRVTEIVQRCQVKSRGEKTPDELLRRISFRVREIGRKH